MSKSSRSVYGEYRRLVISARSNALADRAAPAQTPAKQPIPHYEYDLENPFCVYCHAGSGLRVGRMDITGTVAFCGECEGKYRADRKWESE